MSDEKALLAAIWEHPHDDTPRLMYADWLDEHDQPARAELIRVQVELAGLRGDDPRYDALEARADSLLKAWGKVWWKAMPAGAREGQRFDRGFPVPYLGRLSIPGLVKLGAARLTAAPLWRYHYGVHGESLDALLGWAFLHRLELFALRPPLPDGWADRLAGCANLRNVAELSFVDSRVTAADLRAVLDAWADRPLHTLTAHLDEGGLRLLAAHPTAAKLRTLSLSYCGLKSDTLTLLTSSPHLTGLLSLHLGGNPLGDAGVAELVRWPGLSGLRRLFIDRAEVTDAGVAALAASPTAASLRTLWLSMNTVGAAGAAAVVASPHLARLKRVSFYGTPAATDPTANSLLRKRFGRGNY